MSAWSDRVKGHFPDVALNKAVVEDIGLRDKPIPSYVVDWLAGRYGAGDTVDVNALNAFIEKHLPDKTRKEQIKHRLLEGRRVKILDSLKVSVNLARGDYVARLSCLDLSARIRPSLVNEYPVVLYGDTWGQAELSYVLNEDLGKGEVWIENFKMMQTGQVDIQYFVDQRKHFTLEEWADMLVASIGYDPDYYTFRQKIYLLVRLVPLVHPRVNLIELSPKGTGKSTVFSKLSWNVWLVSGGIVTRAKLFYDMSRKIEGIIALYDVVVLDEVQTIRFTEPGEIIGALKGYLESGEYRVMGHRGTAESGLVILANIPIGSDGLPCNRLVLEDLPKFMQETAFIDRFHGLLPGWVLPRIEKCSLISAGNVLRSDYLSEVFYLLRKKTEYTDFAKTHIRSTGDIRDVRAVERVGTGLLKLLYPDLQVDMSSFEKYCVDVGKELRSILREQMALSDSEYKREIADIDVA